MHNYVLMMRISDFHCIYPLVEGKLRNIFDNLTMCWYIIYFLI